MSRTLRKGLGLFSGLSVVAGTVVGSGIFIKQNVMAQSLGRIDWILLVWLAGGLLSTMGGLVYAELAASMPESGGAYVYIREAYGRFVAFLMGWTQLFFSRPAATGALAVLCASLIGLEGISQLVASITLIVVLSLLNVFGVEVSGRFQSLALVFKAVGLLAVSSLPLIVPPPVSTLNSGYQVTEVSLATAFLAVLWAYDGWYNVTTVSEEIIEPGKNLPKALIGGISLVTLLYLLINLGIHSAVPMEALAKTSQPAALMVETLAGQKGALLFRCLVLGSVIGTLHVGLLCAPRVFFAMGRDGLLPTSFAETHPRFKTPTRAIGVYGAWSVCLVLVSHLFRGKENLFDMLTNYVIFGVLLFSSLTCCTLFVLRKKYPDRDRPYRCLGYPATPLILLSSLMWLLYLNLVERPVPSLISVAIIFLGAPLYRRWSPPPKEVI